MTYAISQSLQTAIYDALRMDAALVALVGTDIFDAPPRGSAPPLYVLIGDEVVRDRSSKTQRGAAHDLRIDVISDASGFSLAKQAAAAVCDAIVDRDLVLARGRLTGLRFRSARALRDTGPSQRQIQLRFRALVSDS